MFKGIVKEGVNIHGRFIYIRYIQFPGCRIAVVVPKKLGGSVSKRNRLKRQVRGISKKYLSYIDNYACLVFIKRTFGNKDLRGIEEEIRTLFSKIGASR